MLWNDMTTVARNMPGIDQSTPQMLQNAACSIVGYDARIETLCRLGTSAQIFMNETCRRAENQYQAELRQAQEEVQQSRYDAWQANVGASRYAHMVSVLGVGAMEEIRDRDTLCTEMRQAGQQYECIAKHWESTAHTVYAEANSHSPRINSG